MRRRDTARSLELLAFSYMDEHERRRQTLRGWGWKLDKPPPKRRSLAVDRPRTRRPWPDSVKMPCEACCRSIVESARRCLPCTPHTTDRPELPPIVEAELRVVPEALGCSLEYRGRCPVCWTEVVASTFVSHREINLDDPDAIRRSVIDTIVNTCTRQGSTP